MIERCLFHGVSLLGLTLLSGFASTKDPAGGVDGWGSDPENAIRKSASTHISLREAQCIEYPRLVILTTRKRRPSRTFGLES